MRAALLLAIGLVCTLLPAAEAAEEVRWSGEVVLHAPFILPPGTTLVVEPGTNITTGALRRGFAENPTMVSGNDGYLVVLGRLVMEGTSARPILLRANLTVPSEGSASLRWVHVDAADFHYSLSQCAVRTAGTMTIADSTFTNNTNALCVLDGRAEVLRSRFLYNGHGEGNVDQPACPAEAVAEAGREEAEALQPICLREDHGTLGAPGEMKRCWVTWRGEELCRGWTQGRSVVFEGGSAHVADSHFEDNAESMYVYRRASLVAEGNRFVDNAGGIGIEAQGGPSRHVVVRANSFELHGHGFGRPAPWRAAALEVGGRSFYGPPPAVQPTQLVVEDNLFRANHAAIGVGGDVRGVLFRNNTVVDNGVGLALEWGYATVEGGRFANDPYDFWLWQGEGHLELRNVSFDPAKVRIDEDRSAVVHDGGVLRKAGLFAALLGALALAAGALTEAGRWLLVKGALALGYTRLRREDLLRQSTRGRLLARIAAEPGAHLRDLAREAGSYGGAVYHLSLLEREGLVRSARDGVRRRFYPAGRAPPGSDMSPLARQLLTLVRERPGVGLSEAARSLGCSRQLAAYHAGALAEAGLLERAEGQLRLSGASATAPALGP